MCPRTAVGTTTHHDLELLAPHAVWLWPVVIVLACDLRVLHDASELGDDSRCDHYFLANHRVVLVVGIVCVTQHACGGRKLEFHELVPELALMADAAGWRGKVAVSWR